MKKIFTFAAAVLASVAMMAQEFTFTGSSLPEGWVGTSLGSTNFAGESDKVLKVSASGTLTYTFSEAVDITSIDFTFSFGSKDAGKAVDLEAFDTNETSLGTAQLTQAEKQTGSNIKQEANIEFAYSGVKKFTITNSSDKNFLLGYLKFNTGSVTPPAPATEPCTTVTIEGPATAEVGEEVTFKATGFDATPDVINWYLGMDLVSEKDTYTFTPNAAGEYTIQVTAWNAYNTENVDEAYSYTVLTVTEPAKKCGEIIKATHDKGTTATVTGTIGGTYDKKMQDNGKFGAKGHYFGITLAKGTFQAGDELNVHITQAAQQGTIAVYAEKEGTTLLYNTGELGVVGDNIFALPAALNGLSTLYICRPDDDSNKWNGYVDYIAVNRSCEASSNADLAKVWVMAGSEEQIFEPEEDGVTYNLVVPASVEMTELSINYTLAHPKATADVASPFVIAVPAAGAAANSQAVVVTAENGTKKTYTFNVTKSAAASTDASLKSLSVEGYTLDPAFASDVYTYTITKAYGAENPGTNKVSCEPNDPTAHDNIEAGENSLIVTVTAEDGKTQLVYTINIVKAAAKKDLLEATFSNGVHGYIASGKITVPYLAGEAEPTFVSAKFWKADGEPKAEMVNGNLVVTGIDGEKAEYEIEYQALTPMAASYEEITFTEVPSYIYSIYGFAEDKGVKFAKDVEEATNHRISEGKDRIYIALPVAKEVILTGGSAGARPVVITVNGVKSDVASTPKEGETITIPLVAQEGANLVGIESNGNSGDAGFIKLQLVEGVPTGIENTKAAVKAVKVVRDGQMMILKNGVLYNMQGAVVK